mmetsp:Transcript_8398/g.26044  ORF Transcript_8398/g.26044 Transcript_8398/m.26044 type:complete len:160 (-) Transcript_8398:180-659(-)
MLDGVARFDEERFMARFNASWHSWTSTWLFFLPHIAARSYCSCCCHAPSACVDSQSHPSRTLGSYCGPPTMGLPWPPPPHESLAIDRSKLAIAALATRGDRRVLIMCTYPSYDGALWQCYIACANACRGEPPACSLVVSIIPELSIRLHFIKFPSTRHL